MNPTAWRANDMLVGALRRLPRVDAADRDALFAEAEPHGLGGVLFEAYRTARVDVDGSVAMRAVARELQAGAQRGALGLVDAAFAASSIRAAILKGASVARFYPSPSARVSSDIDILVRQTDLERATTALGSLGYTCADSDAMREWSLAEHHHHVFAHPASMPVELHFLAYRGFGAEIPSEPLLERSAPFEGFRALRVLDRADEIAYLATHAAAHRFGRLGWLYDIALLVRASTLAERRAAAARARSWGFARALAFAASLLAETFAVETEGLGELGRLRGRLLRAVVFSPEPPLARAATRFAYSALLADTVGRSMKYTRIATMQRARRTVGRR